MSDNKLKKMPLFENLSEGELKQLNQLLQGKKYAAGEVVFNQGEPGGNLYLIEKGHVQISILIKGLINEFEKIAVLKEGNFLGALSLFDNKEHSAKATALTDTKVLILTRDDFRNIVQQNPQRGIELQEHIILALTSIIREINTRYADLSGYIAT